MWPGKGEVNERGVLRYIHDRSKRENRAFVIGWTGTSRARVTASP